MSIIGFVNPPRVGDWWMCPSCGDARNKPSGNVATRFACPKCFLTESHEWPKPLTLTEADWLKCRAPQALIAMVDAIRAIEERNPPAIPLGPAPDDLTESWVRCTVGNPFRPWVSSADVLWWGDGTVGRLAEGCTSWNKRDLCPECNGSGTREPRYSRKERRAGDCLKCKGTGETEYLVEGVVPEQFPILADALEEAGCDREDVLRHLREPGEHWPGCFVLRAILAP